MRRAAAIYARRTERPNSFEEKVYCDFKKLEDGLKEYCRINNIELPNQNQSIKVPEASRPLTMAERMAAAKEAAKETAKETAATREMKKPPERE